jgi:hypothetical protein
MRNSIFMVYERLLVASASGLGGNLELLNWCPEKNRCRSVEQWPLPRAGPCRWNRGPCDRHFAWPRIDEKCSRAETPWVERKPACSGPWWPFAWRHKSPYILNSNFKSRPDLKHEKQKKIINLRRRNVKTFGHYWPGSIQLPIMPDINNHIAHDWRSLHSDHSFDTACSLFDKKSPIEFNQSGRTVTTRGWQSLVPSARESCCTCTKRKNTLQEKDFRPCWWAILEIKHLHVDSALDTWTRQLFFAGINPMSIFILGCAMSLFGYWPYRAQIFELEIYKWYADLSSNSAVSFN